VNGLFISLDSRPTHGGDASYAYADQNPVLFTDWTGNSLEADDEAQDAIARGLRRSLIFSELHSWARSETSPNILIEQHDLHDRAPEEGIPPDALGITLYGPSERVGERGVGCVERKFELTIAWDENRRIAQNRLLAPHFAGVTELLGHELTHARLFQHLAHQMLDASFFEVYAAARRQAFRCSSEVRGIEVQRGIHEEVAGARPDTFIQPPNPWCGRPVVLMSL
jgi:hypothetical protein